MSAGMQTIIYPVKDLARAKALFSALLEVEPYADEPYYVGFKAAGQDIGLDPNGHAKGMTGPVPYWHVTDLRERLAALVAAGAELLQDAQDVGGGRLIAFVKDADGNLVGLLQDPAA
ncbi:putative enzyme related to lactoylglutathione lyase [Streptomyces sp. 3330]|uniref:VOC family protein n=1 Tax=Streptomyces sp. 3330 TaxID=2817755 RepID=UPI0028677692|nr:VOC family protein [Streptomyces sp. 3330]MDR6975285.1 putative enzyme related to lactoylglutathione lyase [Streptomyces sp. 3330]